MSIGVKNDLSNPKTKRWNMYYAAPVSFSSAGTSFRDGYDCIDTQKKFNTDKIRKGRSFLERFDCMLAYLEIQDYAVFLSDIVKAIQIDIQSLYNYISIFTLVKSKPELLVKYNSQIIYPSKFRFKKKMRILLKLRRIET